MGILIKNVHILGAPESERTDVYITGKRIAGIGKEPRRFPVNEILDGTDKILMPGLVNAHTHAYMSVLRNYADDVPFQTWLFDRVSKVEEAMTPEEAYWGNLLSVMEMIRTGTTCFVDMQMFPRQAVRACADSGMRAMITRGLVGSDRHDEGGLRRLAEAFDEMEFAGSIAAPVTFGLGPHAIYSCGEDFLRYVTELAAEKDLPLNIHLAETQGEFDTCIKEHGLSPVAYLHSLGMLDRRILLAHCVYLAEEDYALLRRDSVTVAANPASNMKLANGFAPVTRMVREGIRVALGTDGPASNNTLNLFGEMHLLSMSQKGAEKDALAMTAEETLRCAVENGYAALGMEETHGAVETGRTADLILIDEKSPNLRPVYNRKKALVYSASGYEVSDVIIDGKLVMKDRNFVTIDGERVYYEMDRIAEKYRI